MPFWKFVESIMGFGKDISILSFVSSSHKDERDREVCLGISERDRVTRENEYSNLHPVQLQIQIRLQMVRLGMRWF